MRLGQGSRAERCEKDFVGGLWGWGVQAILLRAVKAEGSFLGSRGSSMWGFLDVGFSLEGNGLGVRALGEDGGWILVEMQSVQGWVESRQWWA